MRAGGVLLSAVLLSSCESYGGVGARGASILVVPEERISFADDSYQFRFDTQAGQGAIDFAINVIPALPSGTTMNLLIDTRECQGGTNVCRFRIGDNTNGTGDSNYLSSDPPSSVFQHEITFNGGNETPIPATNGVSKSIPVEFKAVDDLDFIRVLLPAGPPQGFENQNPGIITITSSEIRTVAFNFGVTSTISTSTLPITTVGDEEQIVFDASVGTVVNQIDIAMEFTVTPDATTVNSALVDNSDIKVRMRAPGTHDGGTAILNNQFSITGGSLFVDASGDYLIRFFTVISPFNLLLEVIEFIDSSVVGSGTPYDFAVKKIRLCAPSCP